MNRRFDFSVRRMRLVIQAIVAILIVVSSLAVAPAALAETAPAWTGYYYNNTTVSGAPVVTRTDVQLNFDWGMGTPDAAIMADGFSAQWAATAALDGGTYVFTVWADDGVRVWVDDLILIDQWHAHQPTNYTGSRYLAPGNHSIRVAYYEATGAASLRVSWAKSGPGAPPPPATGTTIVVDDRSPGFVWGGPLSARYSRQWGYNGWLYWTWNSNTVTYNWGKWFPYVSVPGTYEVQVYIPSRYANTARAHYVISRNGVENTVIINQAVYSNQWVSLGSYAFSGGANEYVYLPDATGETYVSRYVAYDAVRFIKDGTGTAPSQPSTCSITPVLGMGRIWNNYARVRNGLGCPTEAEKTVWMANQLFVGGRMLWRQDNLAIYVLYNNGTWQQATDTWTSAEPEWDVSIVAPSGYYQPKRGFGKVWRTVAGVRNALGWATTEEAGFFGAVQQFTGGVMIFSPSNGFFVLYNTGQWERLS